MDSLILKSFFPEIFLSVSVLLQIVYNSRIINLSKFNSPIIGLEVSNQTLFLLISVFFLLYNIKIEGIFSNYIFVNDGGSRYIKLFLTIFFISSIYALKKMFYVQQLNFIEIYSILLLSLLSMYFLVSSLDLITFYLSVEMQALCFYILSSFKRDSAFSTEAGLKYFISGSFMSAVFLLGSSLIYGGLGTLNLHDLTLILSYSLDTWAFEFNSYLFFGFLCITATILFKLVCAPFHFWAPDVYEGSPIFSTIFFSIIPKLAVLCFFFRWVSCVNNISGIDSFLLYSGLFSIFLGTIFSLRQKRLKRLFIYSSIAQIGFVVCSSSLNTYGGFSSSLFFIFVYIITSIIVWSFFACFHYNQYVYEVFNKTQSSSLFITTFSHFSKYNILWSICCTLLLFSIAGIPPLTGFLSKILVLFELINSSFFWSSIFIIIISSVSVFYYIRLIKIIFFEPTNVDFSINPSFIVFNTVFSVNLYLVVVFNIFLILFIFIFPTELYLVSEYIVLSFLIF